MPLLRDGWTIKAIAQNTKDTKSKTKCAHMYLCVCVCLFMSVKKNNNNRCMTDNNKCIRERTCGGQIWRALHVYRKRTNILYIISHVWAIQSIYRVPSIQSEEHVCVCVCVCADIGIWISMTRTSCQRNRKQRTAHIATVITQNSCLTKRDTNL